MQNATQPPSLSFKFITCLFERDTLAHAINLLQHTNASLSQLKEAAHAEPARAVGMELTVGGFHPLSSVVVSRAATFEDFQRTIEQKFGFPCEQQHLRELIERHNETLRPSRLLVTPEYWRNGHTGPFYVREHPTHYPAPDVDNDLLLIVKYFDVRAQKMYVLGSDYFNKNDRLGLLAPLVLRAIQAHHALLCQKEHEDDGEDSLVSARSLMCSKEEKGSTPSPGLQTVRLQAFDEEDAMTGRVSELSLDRSLDEQKLRNGDILCFNQVFDEADIPTPLHADDGSTPFHGNARDYLLHLAAVKRGQKTSSQSSLALPLIPARLNNLYNSPRFSDVEFCFVDSSERIFAHKNILGARSLYFARMFEGSLGTACSVDSKRDALDLSRLVIEVEESSVVFRPMLSFIYGSGQHRRLELAVLQQLFVAADKYLIQDLKASCSSLLLACLDQTNCFDVLHLASRHSCSRLKEACLRFIHENGSDLVSGPSFKALCQAEPELVQEILSHTYSVQRKRTRYQ